MSNEDSLLNRRRVLTDEQKERLKKAIAEESTPEAMEANRAMAREYFAEHDKLKQFSPSVREYLTWLLRIHVAKEAGETDTLRVEEIRDHLAKLHEGFTPDETAIVLEVNRFINSVRAKRPVTSPQINLRHWIDYIGRHIHDNAKEIPSGRYEQDIAFARGKQKAYDEIHQLLMTVVDISATESFSCTAKPPEPGRYLLASFEWWGKKSDRQRAPRWEIRLWNGVSWEHTRYCPEPVHDEMDCDRFEPVRWQRLPPV